MEGVIFLVLIIGGIWMYQTWLLNGVKPRRLKTKLDTADLRAVFAAKVAVTGWKVVDDGNPMVAQSPLLSGFRQQISLKVGNDGNNTSAYIGPSRLVTKLFGSPTKGHTIRMRLNSFTREVQRRDPSAVVARVD